MWMTLLSSERKNKQNFLQHINSLDLAIQFTVENNKEHGAIPFLDTTVQPETDGKLSITVYRKPTHTQTNTYSGTATSITQLNTVKVHYFIYSSVQVAIFPCTLVDVNSGSPSIVQQ